MSDKIYETRSYYIFYVLKLMSGEIRVPLKNG